VLREVSPYSALATRDLHPADDTALVSRLAVVGLKPVPVGEHIVAELREAVNSKLERVGLAIAANQVHVVGDDEDPDVRVNPQWLLDGVGLWPCYMYTGTGFLVLEMAGTVRYYLATCSWTDLSLVTKSKRKVKEKGSTYDRTTS
jgi:hypothetical protein